MLDFLKDLIISAGTICKKEQHHLKPSDVSFKNNKDLVTLVDKKVENHIIRTIREKYPSHDIFGEETGKTGSGSDFLWIIDPIDGTTSFYHQQPFYAVSIALEKKKETILGAVYLPWFNELFYAQKGRGAFLNNTQIFVSQTDTLINSVMATGFACLRAGLDHNNLTYFNKIVPRLRDVRRYGSAATDLCYVACGRCDGFWEMNLNIYDIAAGCLIVKEAGGIVCDFTGGENYPEQGIIATNPKLENQLRRLFTPLAS